MQGRPSVELRNPGLLLLVLVAGCGRSAGSTADLTGGGPGPPPDAGLTCSVEAGAQQPALPAGVYRGETLAVDWSACGLPPAGTSMIGFLRLELDGSTVKLDPDTVAELSFERCGVDLAGTCTREHQVRFGEQTCILQETSDIRGEVVSEGSLWIDQSFAWDRKGGVCDLLTLPCRGQQTWQLDWNGFEVLEGAFVGTIVAIEIDGCELGYEVGLTTDYLISGDETSLTLCPSGTACFALERNLHDLSGLREGVNIITCTADVTFEGKVLSPTSFVLTRTYTGNPCPCISRMVQSFERAEGPDST